MARRKLTADSLPQETAAQMVVDHVPGADIAAPEPKKVEELTAEAQKPVVPWAQKGAVSVEFHPTMQEIAKIKADSLALLKANTVEGKIETPEAYTAIKQAYLAVVPLRTACDERRLQEGAQAREYVKLVNQLGNTIIEALHEVERPLRLAVQQADTRAQNEAREKAEAIERQQREAEDARLAKIKADEEAKRAAAEKELEDRRKIQEGEERRLKEEKEKFEEQRRKFEEAQAAAREQLDRQNREAQEALKEAQAKIDAENQRIENVKLEERRKQEEAEQKEKRAKEEAAAEARRLEQLEAAKKRAAEEALEAAEKKRQEDERLAKVKADREAAEAIEKAARAPDRQKLMVLVNMIQNIEPPTLKSKEANKVFADAWRMVNEAMDQLEAYASRK